MFPSVFEQIAQQVRLKRKEKRMSQARLADRVPGIQQSTISRWESMTNRKGGAHDSDEFAARG